MPTVRAPNKANVDSSSRGTLPAVPLQYGVYGDLVMIYTKPCSIYLTKTLNPKPLNPKLDPPKGDYNSWDYTFARLRDSFRRRHVADIIAGDVGAFLAGDVGAFLHNVTGVHPNKQAPHKLQRNSRTSS